MGMINITMRGSFSGPAKNETFSAEEGGHAFAITRAIQFLNSQMQAAIMLDHHLARSGDKPPKSDFGMLP
jgi:hypothetical protein